MNEKLSELKTWLLSFSYPLVIIEKAFSTLNCRDLHVATKHPPTNSTGMFLNVVIKHAAKDFF